MKKTLAVLLALLAVLALFASCGKKETELDPNAVLTDSDVPLDVGAEVGALEESEAPSFDA